tara:strand:- start:70 stop:726 length:657 start_codon:yes stop_codon:yes gene_type:complete
MAELYGKDPEYPTQEGAGSGATNKSNTNNNLEAEKWKKAQEQCKIDLDLNPGRCSGCIVSGESYVANCFSEDKEHDEESITDNIMKLYDNLVDANNFNIAWIDDLSERANQYPINKLEADIPESKFNDSCWEEGENEDDPKNYVCNYPEGVSGYHLVYSDISEIDDSIAAQSVREWSDSESTLFNIPWQNIRNVGCGIRQEEYFGENSFVLSCLVQEN